MTDGGRSLQQMSTNGIRPRVIRRHVPDVEVQRLLVQLSAAKLRRSELDCLATAAGLAAVRQGVRNPGRCG